MDLIHAVPIGGHRVHARRKGEYTAVCGYRPEAKRNSQMRDRTGWKYLTERPVSCPKCQRKLAQLERKA